MILLGSQESQGAQSEKKNDLTSSQNRYFCFLVVFPHQVFIIWLVDDNNPGTYIHNKIHIVPLQYMKTLTFSSCLSYCLLSALFGITVKSFSRRFYPKRLTLSSDTGQELVGVRRLTQVKLQTLGIEPCTFLAWSSPP